MFAALALTLCAGKLPGFGDLQFYSNYSEQFVGAQAMVSFSSGSAHGDDGANVSGHGER